MAHIYITYLSANNTNQCFDNSCRAADDVDITFSVDPIIVDDSWYNSTTKYSSLSLLRFDIHKITNYQQKSKIVVKFKDDCSDRNFAKP